MNGAWRRVAWYPGVRFDDCLAIPGSAPLQLLCDSEDGHAGINEQRIFITRADPNTIRVAPDYSLSQRVYRVMDVGLDTCAEQTGSAVAEPCGYWERGKALLRTIGDLRRSEVGGAFAEARIDYAAPRDIDEACHGSCFLDAKIRTGMLRFILKGHVIEVASPFPLQASKTP